MTWTKSSVAEQLTAFNGNTRPDLNAQVQEYLHFYGVDFSTRLPEVKHRWGWIDSPRFRLSCHSWTPAQAKGTVLVLHGYFDHVGLFADLVGFLLENAYAVVTFDLPGHGLSSGEPAAIGDFDDYVDALESIVATLQDMPKPWHALGQSTGGAIIMDYLLSRGDPFQEVVLLAPLVRPALWPMIQAKYYLGRRHLSTVKRHFSRNSGNERFLAFVQQDPLQTREVPVCWVGALIRWVPKFLDYPRRERQILVIQGDGDGTVDWSYNLGRIREHFATTIVMITGGRHHLVNEQDDLRQQVFAAIKMRLQSGGADSRCAHAEHNAAQSHRGP